jgi:hypothetical protein
MGLTFIERNPNCARELDTKFVAVLALWMEYRAQRNMAPETP